ncbi:APC family permease [Kushneria indalinina]|uniref:Amino acid/polyamine/organocation transporter (APC superfamily) n=1 Tax=Kushneria indalinina DSM 14324 TaxID=1122140 RepID=A0A3D9DWE3_9GAMM|nr:APC family permease [Kushneria indalinina]REC94991.1 amino acid/polyamine/organocation transporter (APC superfamily) [Kushneria indalinina DSM 14324]
MQDTSAGSNGTAKSAPVDRLARPTRLLGLKSLMAVAVGLVVSQGVMVIMLQVVGIAGLGFIVPLTIAWILALCYAASFSELSLMIPRAGSLGTYTEVALGHFPAILSVFSGYVVVAMFALSAELLLIDHLLGVLYPVLGGTQFIAFGILGLFALLNLMGIDVFARLQNVLAFAMVLALTLLGLSALTGGFAPHTIHAGDLVADFSLGNGAFTLIALAIWGYVGAEFVCPLIGETRNPGRHVPRAMYMGLTVIFAVFALYCLGALFYLPQDVMLSASLPHLEYARAVFGNSGNLLLAVAAITATCSTLNTSLAAVPRMLQGMAGRGQAFPILGRVTRGNRTPWVAVLFVAIVTGLPLLVWGDDPSTVELLLTAAAIAWLIAYIIAHCNVIALRRRYPEARRPYRSPLYPLPQIIGIAGMLYAIVYASPAPDLTMQIFMSAGVVLGIVSVIAIVWIKTVMKKPLFKPEPLDSVED